MSSIISPRLTGRRASTPKTQPSKPMMRPHSASVDAVSQSTFAVNDVILNRFILTRKLNTTDATQLFCATDLITQQNVTIKICPKTNTTLKELEMSQLFAPDADVKGILHVQSLCEIPWNDCIVAMCSPVHGDLSEFMGWSHSAVRIHRFVSEDLLRDIAVQILSGIKTIHKHGWIHGAIRSENILVRVVHRFSPPKEEVLSEEDEKEEEYVSSTNVMMKMVDHKVEQQQQLQLPALHLDEDVDEEEPAILTFKRLSPRTRAVTTLGELFENLELDDVDDEANLGLLAWIGNLSSIVRMSDTDSSSSSEGLRDMAHCQGRLCMTAPEVLEGNAVDGKIDVFSMGCVLWKCVYGVAPYGIRGDFDPITRTWGNWVYSPQQPPAMNSRHISSELKRMLLGMLELDPENRLSLDEVLKHAWVTK